MSGRIAADTSSLIAFFQGDEGEDVDLVTSTIRNEQLILPPPVLSELLSDPQLPAAITRTMLGLPQLDMTEHFWQRVGELRASVLKQRKKARLADALIAQFCIDHDVPIITRDKDFRHFLSQSSLTVVPN